jgi:hypothetical protein
MRKVNAVTLSLGFKKPEIIDMFQTSKDILAKMQGKSKQPSRPVSPLGKF